MVKIPKMYCSGYSEATTTREGSVERQGKEVLVGIHMYLFYQLAHFLRFAQYSKVELSICSDRCEVGLDNKSNKQF